MNGEKNMTGTMSTLGFFAIVFAVYYMIPLRFRWGALLAASVIFYASADWKMLALIAGSIGISYYAGLQIEKSEDVKKKRGWMTSCIVLLVAILMIFKYYGFFAEQIGKMLGATSFVFNLVMPLGISYYTFKIISYLVDVYRGEVPAQRNFIDFAAYASMFPQLVALSWSGWKENLFQEWLF